MMGTPCRRMAVSSYQPSQGPEMSGFWDQAWDHFNKIMILFDYMAQLGDETTINKKFNEMESLTGSEYFILLRLTT